MVKSVLIVEDHALTRQAVCSLFASQEDFEVRPQYMRAEPHPATESHQTPKKLGSLVTSSDVRQNRQRCTEEKRELREIAKRGEPSTTRHQQRHDHVNANDRAHNSRPPTVSPPRN